MRPSWFRATAGRVAGACALFLGVLAALGAGASPAGAAPTLTAIAAGGSHTCALTSTGTVECWGLDTSGQLGDGTTGATSDVPVPVSRLSGVTAVAAGGNDTCALTSTGTVECWGDNTSDQLGDGTSGATSDGPAPVPVPVPVRGLSGVTAVAVGGDHTCALTSTGTTSTGTVECWGDNGYGQLGDGTTGATSDVPVHVTALTHVTAIAAGEDDTCALTSTGTVECWGDAGSGDLGRGTLGATSDTPVTVPTLTVTAVAAGGQHTCALRSTGTVACWGSNTSGQIGDGTKTSGHVPVTVSTLTHVTAIAAGGFHTCALTSTGTVECWGDNLSGQLGDGTKTTSDVPVTVLPPSTTAPASDCPQGSRACDSGSPGPGRSVTLSSGGVTVTATGRGSAALGTYKSDPVGKAPSGAAFFGLSLTSGNVLRSITVKVCDVASGSLDWWDGTAWVAASGVPTSAQAGCVSVTLGTTSSPNLATITRTSRLSRFGGLVFAVVR